MRKRTSLAFLASLALLVPAAPALAVQSSTVDNPPLAKTCKTDITLTMDASGSVQTAGQVETVRAAGSAFLNALLGTSSTVRLTQFSTMAEQLAPRTSVTSASTTGDGALATGMAHYFNPQPPIPSGWYFKGGIADPVAGPITSGLKLGHTNWQQSLTEETDETTTPGLVVYITDGVPNAYDTTFTSPGGDTYPMAQVVGSADDTPYNSALIAADAAKARGSRMLVVGVGDAVSNPAAQERLMGISGPRLYKNADLMTITDVNRIDVAVIDDFNYLQVFLRHIVTDLCTTSVAIHKYAQTAGTQDYAAAPGWSFSATPSTPGGMVWNLPRNVAGSMAPTAQATTDSQGAATFLWTPQVAGTRSTPAFSETLQAGYAPGRPNAPDWSCVTNDPETGGATTTTGEFTDLMHPGFSLDVGAATFSNCDVYNSLNSITLAKSASAASVPAGGKVTYTYRATNPGAYPLQVRLTDDKCAPVTYTSGDANADGLMQPAETWVLNCTTSLTATTTNTATVVGTPVVNGQPATGLQVSAAAQATVSVSATPAPTPTTTPTASPLPPTNCASSEPDPGCYQFYPEVPLKVTAKSAGSKLTRHAWTTALSSAKAPLATLSAKATCKNSKGKATTGCSIKITSRSKMTIKTKISKCAVKKVTVTVMAKPNAASQAQYRTSFWTRTWKVKGC